MPNWIDNEVKMYGDRTVIDVIKKKYFSDDCLDFDKIVPSPKTKDDCPDKYILKPDDHVEPTDDRPWFNWYEWQYDNWGVKWNASDGWISNNTFGFATPWGCPYDVLVKLSKMHPTITFHVKVDGEIDEPYSFTLKDGIESK